MKKKSEIGCEKKILTFKFSSHTSTRLYRQTLKISHMLTTQHCKVAKLKNKKFHFFLVCTLNNSPLAKCGCFMRKAISYWCLYLFVYTRHQFFPMLDNFSNSKIYEKKAQLIQAWKLMLRFNNFWHRFSIIPITQLWLYLLLWNIVLKATEKKVWKYHKKKWVRKKVFPL